MTAFLYEDLKVGEELKTVVKEIDQEMLNRYARASGDYNPLHTDPEFARQTSFGGTIAQGMLSLAFISQIMTDCFGQAWLEGGEMEASFLAPIRPGDVIKAGGRVVERDEKQGRIICQVCCENQKGQKAVVCRAVATRV